MAGLMIGDDPLFVGGDDLVLLLQTADDPVYRILEVFHLYRLFSLTGGDQRGLVADVGDVRAGKTGRLFGQLMDIQLAGDLDGFQMDLEDGFAAFQIGFVNGDLAVETAGTQQGSVQYVGAVGGGQHDDAAVAAEAVHFHKQLVEGAFPFVVAHDGVLTTGTADGVDLVDEDHAGGLFPGLLEQVADAAGAYPYKQLHEIGTAHREKGHLCFPGHGLGQQGLTGSGRTYQQGALGYFTAKGGIFLGILEKVHDLHDLDFGLVQSRDIAEGDRHLGTLVEEGGL